MGWWDGGMAGWHFSQVLESWKMRESESHTLADMFHARYLPEVAEC